MADTYKFAVLLNLFVGDVAERIEKYSSGSFVCLGGFGKCALKVAGARQRKTAGAGRTAKPRATGTRPEEALISDIEAIALVIMVTETRAAAARPDTARFQLAGGLTAASIGADNIAERAADPLDAVMTPLRDL
jgi:hypothetical protein